PGRAGIAPVVRRRRSPGCAPWDPASSGACAQTLAPVDAVLHVAAPVEVVQIPADGLAQPALKGFLRLPAELALDPAGIDGITDVVTGPVRDVGDERRIGRPVTRGRRRHVLEQRADR